MRDSLKHEFSLKRGEFSSDFTKFLQLSIASERHDRIDEKKTGKMLNHEKLRLVTGYSEINY